MVKSSIALQFDALSTECSFAFFTGDSLPAIFLELAWKFESYSCWFELRKKVAGTLANAGGPLGLFVHLK